MSIMGRVSLLFSRLRIAFRQFVYCVKTEGLGVAVNKSFRIVFGRLNNTSISYRDWMKDSSPSETDLDAQRQCTFNRQITFSILTPLYNTNEEFLRQMIESVVSQTYSDWELCLADGSDNAHSYVGDMCKEYSSADKRIKYLRLDDNLGIVGNSNKCMELATGDYISLLDHDDVLHPSALYETMKVIVEKNADFVYTDEMTFISPNVSEVVSIHFKPDYAPDNLMALNYICHFTSFRRSLLNGESLFREGYDGSQDHELFLRLTRNAKCIVHVPKVLYYWRSHPQSTSQSADSKSYATEAGIKAVKSHCEALGFDVSVDRIEKNPFIYRVQYSLPDPLPKVSIVIPNYEHVSDLRKCITSIKEKSSYTNYEIIIVENNSKDKSVFDYYDELTDKYSDIRVVKWNGTGFNWAALNNFGVYEAAQGDYLLFLNNDTQVISSDWIEQMLMYAQRSDVGAVGAMLYYPNDTIQHAGIIIWDGVKSIAVHAFCGYRRGESGYMGRLLYAQNYTAVTGACMMIRRSVWEEVNGFDESLAVSYNDLDFCLRVREKGYLNIWTPYAELYHFEYKSRGVNDTPEKMAITEKETEYIKMRWKTIFDGGDPYYNPNMCLLPDKQFTPCRK